MNFKRYLLATLAVFIFIFLYEFLLHGHLLLPIYKATANVWRDFAQMQAEMPLAMCFQLALAAWTTFAFSQLSSRRRHSKRPFLRTALWSFCRHPYSIMVLLATGTCRSKLGLVLLDLWLRD